jgi:hypothetical protein
MPSSFFFVNLKTNGDFSTYDVSRMTLENLWSKFLLLQKIVIFLKFSLSVCRYYCATDSEIIFIYVI